MFLFLYEIYLKFYIILYFKVCLILEEFFYFDISVVIIFKIEYDDNDKMMLMSLLVYSYMID